MTSFMKAVEIGKGIILDKASDMLAMSEAIEAVNTMQGILTTMLAQVNDLSEYHVNELIQNCHKLCMAFNAIVAVEEKDPFDTLASTIAAVADQMDRVDAAMQRDLSLLASAAESGLLDELRKDFATVDWSPWWLDGCIEKAAEQLEKSRTV